MRFDVIIYKQYDTDLLSLVDAGYDIGLMFKEALIGYANGLPVAYYIDRLVPLSLNDKKSARISITISDGEVKTVYMLKNIKHLYRGRFCKAVLRNAFVQQNICGYFADENLMQLQMINLQNINLSAFKNLKPVSEYIKEKQIKFANTVVNIAPKEAVDLSAVNPYQNAVSAPIEPKKKKTGTTANTTGFYGYPMGPGYVYPNMQGMPMYPTNMQMMSGVQNMMQGQPMLQPNPAMVQMPYMQQTVPIQPVQPIKEESSVRIEETKDEKHEEIKPNTDEVSSSSSDEESISLINDDDDLLSTFMNM